MDERLEPEEFIQKLEKFIPNHPTLKIYRRIYNKK